MSKTKTCLSVSTTSAGLPAMPASMPPQETKYLLDFIHSSKTLLEAVEKFNVYSRTLIETATAAKTSTLEKSSNQAKKTLDLKSEKELFIYLQNALNTEIENVKFGFGGCNGNFVESHHYELEMKFRNAGQREGYWEHREWIDQTQPALIKRYLELAHVKHDPIKANLSMLEVLRSDIQNFVWERAKHFDSMIQIFNKIFSKHTAEYDKMKKAKEEQYTTSMIKSTFLIGCYKPSEEQSFLQKNFIKSPLYEKNTLEMILKLF